jgi:hypothetical protein
MNKDLKIVHNVLQCVYAIPLGFTTWNLSEMDVIAKMAYLVEFWLILEREIVEHAPHRIFIVWI